MGDVTNDQEVVCLPDTSFSVDSAYAGSFDTELGDTICPVGETDFWQFTVSQGKLVRVDLEYNKLSDIQLAIQWFRPDGVCTSPSPAPCTVASDCEGANETCDLLRGCVDSDAPSCLLSGGTDCAGFGGTVCNLSQEPLPREVVLENELIATPDMHRVVGYFPAFAGGTHFLALNDDNELEEDDEFQYSLTVSEIDDPDTNEPNNALTDATPLQSGVAQVRTLSYQLDEDWYVIDPGFATPAVIDIELRSDSSNTSDPTWTLFQGDSFRLDSVREIAEGDGTSTTRVRRNTVVVPSTEPIYIHITNRNTSTTISPAIPPFNPDETYTLLVTAFEDTDEGLNRDDSPVAANNMALETVQVANNSPTLLTDAGTVIARNDSDWYRLNTGDFAGTAPTENTLLFARISAADPITTGFQLIAQFFKPNGVECSAAIQCPGGLVCDEQIGECLELWVQRPDPRGAGNPEIGGLSPNLLQTMLPIHRTNPGDEPRILMRVAHDQTTTLDIAGFNQTATYTVELAQVAEPDAGDRATRDNEFVAQPLVDDNDRRGPDDFGAVWRTNNNATEIGRIAGVSGAQVVPGTAANPSVCTAIPLEAFDSFGAPLEGGAFTVDGGVNTMLFGDPTCTAAVVAPAPVSFTAGASTIYIITTETAAAPLTLSDGSFSETFNVPTDGTRPLTFADRNGDPILRGFPDSGGSAIIRILFPTNSLQVAQTLTLNASPMGGVACSGDEDGNCEGLATTCTETPTESCVVEAIAGNNNYEISVSGDRIAPYVLTVTGNGFAESKLVMVPFGGSSVIGNGNSNNPGQISGFLSYDGDQDFFRFTASQPLGRGGLTGFLVSVQSEIDIRVRIERNGNGVSFGDLSEDDDLNPCDVDSGDSLTERNTCRQAAKTLSRGPAAVGGEAECVFTFPPDDGPDTFDIWVNEVFSNDFDLDNSYSIKFDFVEGCPASCNAFICSQ